MTVKELTKEIENMFTKAGIDSPAFDAMCLIEKVFNINFSNYILKNTQSVSYKDREKIISLANRRIKGEPLQYILGKWQFYNYDFLVGEGVLIPRDDTEVLLSVCLDFLKTKKEFKVLDLCSGSGALSISISKDLDTEVYAIEKSPLAFEYLEKNIQLNNAKVIPFQDDIFTCMDKFQDGFFDLILSNPPYVKKDDIKNLQKEISFEPEMALDGGVDGYDFYKHIVKYWSPKLKSGGMMAFELGEGQFETVKNYMEQENLINIKDKLDLSLIQRVIYGTK